MAFGDAKFTPNTPPPIVEEQVAKWEIYSFSGEWGLSVDQALLHATLYALKADNTYAVDSRGKKKTLVVAYEGQDARDRISALEVADCTVIPLHRRLLETMVADGKLPPGIVG